MDNLINNYIGFLENNKGLSENTRHSYKRDIIQYVNYLEGSDKKVITNTDKSTVVNYLVELQKNGRSTSTVSRSLASIRSFYQYIADKNLIEKNPTSELESPKVEKKFPQVLSTNEVELLLDQPKCNDLKGFRDKAMLEILYATGMRVSELISLNLNDIELKTGYIKCQGSQRERTIPLHSQSVKALKSYLSDARPKIIKDAEENALFVNTNGTRLTRQGFWKIIKYYKNMANINKDITPHTLRHSLATHLMENGADMKMIQEIMGHSDISSTQLYANMAKARAQEVFQKAHPRGNNTKKG